MGMLADVEAKRSRSSSSDAADVILRGLRNLGMLVVWIVGVNFSSVVDAMGRARVECCQDTVFSKRVDVNKQLDILVALSSAYDTSGCYGR